MPCFSFFFLSAQDCTCCGLDRPVDTPRRRNATWQTRDKVFFFFSQRENSEAGSRREVSLKSLWRSEGAEDQCLLGTWCTEPSSVSSNFFRLDASCGELFSSSDLIQIHNSLGKQKTFFWLSMKLNSFTCSVQLLLPFLISNPQSGDVFTKDLKCFWVIFLPFW